MIDPAKDYELLQEAAEEAIEEFKEFLKEVWNHGLFIFPRQKPRVRYAFYASNTLPDDIFVVTNPDYLKLRDEGLMGPLACEVKMQAYAAEQAQIMAQTAQFEAEYAAAKPDDMMQTMPAPQPTIQPPPMLWVYLLQIPDIFTWAGSDYRSLLNAQLDKAMAVPVPYEQSKQDERPKGVSEIVTGY